MLRQIPPAVAMKLMKISVKHSSLSLKVNIGAEDDEGNAVTQDSNSQHADRQDDEGQDAEGGQLDEGAVKDVHMVPGTQACKNVWKFQDNDFNGDLPPLLGDWKLNVEGRDPVDFFRHLFPADLIDDIVHNTNLYALQKGRENLAVTREEMQIFLGINMVMGYIRYPRARMYWSSEDGLHLRLIANAMSVNRYDQILGYLHFETFKAAADPEEFQSIDEQIIPFTGLLSIKQYMPKKPKPWGVKAWVRAGTSGYMYRFDVYQGSARRDRVIWLGMAGDVVMRFCDDIKHKNHKVFFDNYFCNISLIEALKDCGIYGTGTCRANRLKGANQKLKSERQLKEEGRGACCVVSDNANISVTRWLDSSVATERRGQRSLLCCHPLMLYNQHMGGVDLIDQCVAMYPHRCRNKRWYIGVFFHFLDVTMVNAWRLYLMSGLEKMNLLFFKASVARALINAGSLQQSRRGRPSATPPPVCTGNHWPQLTEVKNANRCHDAACTRKTKYICMQCCVPLCPGCFVNFHAVICRAYYSSVQRKHINASIMTW
uniref:PiggyBac transposable element-derived protein domain-containing protein n=1 Tax=Monopterus albus TaxID=43700 RepID=A0A3Q3J369_MONAL